MPLGNIRESSMASGHTPGVPKRFLSGEDLTDVIFVYKIITSDMCVEDQELGIVLWCHLKNKLIQKK